MHEMSLVHDLVDVVVEHAQKNGMAQVKAVYLTIGQGRDIVVEFLDGLFKHLARNTIAAGADIVVEQRPITVQCNKCAHVFPINVYDEATWTCPGCGVAKDYVLKTGLEFYIDRIEAVEPSEEPQADEAPSEEASPEA